ncbi:MAG: transposase [Curvibacter sp. RIFCSPHIGHO2_12_FULL_63_18]|uniref:helix-turn-helix domain-containing protein n=1 Tax=Rhodoferax sp. TaxID=50421 RepID=UPI0008B0AFC1|nr:helix-turn-helix domain-containing protein [Rhodoferax sp.]OGO97510.1 MAG: transposase [Curvibacter sp. GWA2_63_95]OGO98745.1 MAG: transposase [Curvibacter sp. RIFCSPHIGHO2_12_FULL_63_18]HCX81406.1 transposase [Rhodoferax sp.]
MRRQAPTQLWVTKGSTFTNEGREYVVLRLADINLVLAKDLESGERVLLKIGDMGPPRRIEDAKPVPQEEQELLDVPNELWAIAQVRREWIEPLLVSYQHNAQARADQIAAAAQVSRATVYRWVAAFRQTGLLSSLLPNTRRRGGKNGSRILPEVEALIHETLKNFHDTEQQQSIAETVTEIRRRCSNAGLPLPAMNTIRVRLERTDGRERTRRRAGPAAAHDQHDPIKGVIPDADWPLAIVQIDHTLLPVIIVDDIHRKPINRAWVTLAIDVNSRVCLGMFLTLDAPSAMSAGMCIANAILPKEAWLRRLGITSVEWPVWGVMGTLHMDNAREFLGDMLKAACSEYDIDIHLRPVKTPRYGAHIERLMGTVTQGLKTVKGATFSGPAEKGEYDAEGNACMTFAEIEKWLVLFFARYHIDKHNGIGMSPLQKWREGLLGTKGKPGRGLPARRLDEELLRINFTPYIERTVQGYGVVIDDVHYYHDVLRPWINAPHPEFPKHKRKFRFHRDPRDISQLYFFDELSGRYVQIPYRDTSLPPVSIWELREAHRKGAERGISPENEKATFAIITEQRELEADAAAKTKSARREQQRRTEHEKQRGDKAKTMPTVSRAPELSAPPPAVRGYDPDEVQALDDD